MTPCNELTESVVYWQSALRLDDWKIAVAQAAPNELECQQCRARVDMQPFQREATVILRSLETFDEDTEREIVHELLHCVFAQWALCVGQNESSQLPMEQGINAVGNLLVSLRRV